MVKLIPGKKGSGKTKLLINAIHTAQERSKGNVVAVQIGSALNAEINHGVRLINIEDYRVTDTHEMFGFIGGIMSSDYDCTDIFVDGILRIVGRNFTEVGKMFEKIAGISEGLEITFTISEDAGGLPPDIKKYL